MKNHTCKYEVGIDREIEVQGKIYYVAIEAYVDFDGEADPVENSLEIEYALVSLNEGENLAVIDNTKQGDKVRVPDPVAEKAIDEALWQAISEYGSDNCSDIARDVDEDYEASYAEWHRE